MSSDENPYVDGILGAINMGTDFVGNLMSWQQYQEANAKNEQQQKDMKEIDDGVIAGVMEGGAMADVDRDRALSYQQHTVTSRDNWNQYQGDVMGRMGDTYDTMMPQYQARTDRAMGMVEQMGVQQRKDINERYSSMASNQASDMKARGMAGTTVMPSMAAGVERERSGALGRLDETLMQNRLNVYGQYSGQQLGYQQQAMGNMDATYQNMAGAGFQNDMANRANEREAVFAANMNPLKRGMAAQYHKQQTIGGMEYSFMPRDPALSYQTGQSLAPAFQAPDPGSGGKYGMMGGAGGMAAGAAAGATYGSIVPGVGTLTGAVVGGLVGGGVGYAGGSAFDS